MTTAADFDEDEWERLVAMPWVAGLVVILADPSFRMLGEMAAMTGAIVDAGHEGPAGALIDALVADAEDREERGETRGEERGGDDLDSMIEMLASCGTIIRERCTAAEAAHVRDWVGGIARVTAEARREGGVLGVGAVRVSDAEVDALARIEAALDG
jgi:hypothetical protein